MTWASDEEINKDVLDTVNGAMPYAYLSCGIEFQREHIGRLAILEEKLRTLRENYISGCSKITWSFLYAPKPARLRDN